MENRKLSEKDEIIARQYGRERNFWLMKLSGELVKSYFPYDYEGTGINKRSIELVEFRLDKDIFSRLIELSRGLDQRLHMILAAGLIVVLNKYTGNTDIIIGVPIYKQDIEGDFINTALALRNPLQDKMSFKELLLQVRQTIREAVENQNYPIETLLYHLNMTFSQAVFPLFDVVLLLENIHNKSYIQHIPHNVTFSFLKTDDHVTGIVEYNSLYYARTTIERIISYFKIILQEAIFSINLPISGITLLSAEERKRILYDLNDTNKAYPGDKTIDELFEEQAQRNPGKLSLVSENGSLTYAEVKEKANRLALFLLLKGVKKEMIVGIIAERSLEMVIGILAILQVGGVYLPIDFEYPGKRKKYILADSNVKLLLTNCRDIKKDVPDIPGVLDLGNPGVYRKGQDFKREHYFDNLAYIMYTSGSTGGPKGVMVEHRNVVRLVKNTNYIEFGRDDKILQTGVLEFDASTFEIWGALLNGLRLYLFSKEKILTHESLGKTMERYGITTMWMTSPLFNQMLDYNIGIFKGLTNLLVGGDVLSPHHINRLRRKYPGLHVINGYGPTENTTFSTTYLVDREYKKSIPIGKQIANSTAYIVDRNKNPVAIGIPGELWLGGDGVSRGYLNNPELTAEKFGHDLWDYQDYHYETKEVEKIRSLEVKKTKKTYKQRNNQKLLRGVQGGGFLEKSPPGRRRQKIYKTGDLARWLPDGNIDFLGRMDHQVKIRGYRIEPGEIENHLSRLGFIRESVVVDRVSKSGEGEKYLCAYFAANEEVDISGLRRMLSNSLPDYMIPSYFVKVEHIPLTPNKKVDIKALPEPELKAGEDYTAPRDEVEDRLAGLWAQVLRIKKEIIGIDNDFFELGGHSLNATMLISNIHKEMRVKVPLSEIFRTPSIRELSAYIKCAKQEIFASIEAVEKKYYHETSSVQRRLYILQQMSLNLTNYNIPQAMALEGIVDKVRMEKTFTKLIHRHESLRTSFTVVNDEPVQDLHDKVEFEIEYYDLIRTEVKVKVEELEGTSGLAPLTKKPAAALINSFIRPYDLSQAPLLRVGLIKLEKKKHILMVDMHHIITDGTSMGVFVKEFMELYEGKELPPLKIQYKDFSQWQNNLTRSGKIKEQEFFWLKQFEGEIPVLHLPYDFKRPVIQAFVGDAKTFMLEKRETAALKEIARQENTTLFIVLLAVYNIFISKLSSQEDIVIGSPIACRRHADLKNVIGMMVNTLALKNSPVGEKTFKNFLWDVNERTLQAFENQEYQFEDLVEKVKVRRDTGRNPLFDVAFVLQNMAVPQLEIRELILKPYDYENKTSKFDMMFTGFEAHDRLVFSVEYCTKLFKGETIERFIEYFKKIVFEVIYNTKKKLSQVEIISEEIKRQIVDEFNNTHYEYPEDKIIHQLFEEQAARKPDNTALVGGNPKSQIPNEEETRGLASLYITYRELNEKSNRLAWLLKEKGVQPDTIVGIMVEPSIEMIVGIFGILKAGGAYLPIDPEYPRYRIDYMLADSTAKVLLDAPEAAVEEKIGQPDGLYFRIINMEKLSSPSTLTSTSICQVGPANLAYIIYTSGSTGKPKGVMIEHSSAVNILFSLYEAYPLSPTDSYLFRTSFVFDVSVSELFAWFMGGSRLIILDEDERKDPQKIINTIESSGITHINFIPSMFYVFLEGLANQNIDKLSTLKYIFLAGETLQPQLVNKSRSLDIKVDLENLYGPTEGTVYTSRYSLLHWDGKGNIPIGKPMQNIKTYILDKQGHLQPGGVPGELSISGAGLARGYLNNPELTKEGFIELKIYMSHMSYMSYIYKTGDLARWLPDGNIEFLGRIDYQVKIRGFRIELGEIESQLLNHQDIKETVVMEKEGEDGDKYLCAYVVPHSPGSNGTTMSAQWREYLSRQIPGYMIPSFFVHLEKIPLTENGKVDRKALPAPGLTAGEEYLPPANEIEEKLREIWSEVLHIKKEIISINDNFFYLGGHSLKGNILVSKIYKELDVNVPLINLFKTPTIRGLSTYISEAKAEAAACKYGSIKAAEKKEYYKLSSTQRRLYFLKQLNPVNIGYNLPVVTMLEGEITKKKIEEIFKKLITRHESLRTSFEWIAGEPVQKIHEHVGFEIKYHQVEVEEQERSSLLEGTRGLAPLSIDPAAALISSFIRPFDLSHAPLLRVGLIEIPHTPAALRAHPSQEGKVNKYILMLDMHHIISDGISMGVFESEFFALYSGEKLLPLKLGYKDYSQWQNRQKESPGVKKQEAYWLKQFADEVPVLNLPADYPRPAVRSFEGKNVNFEIDSEVTRALQELALNENMTLFMVLLSIYTILLAKLGGQEDIIVGTPIMGRRHADLEQVIGMFVNTLVLRNYPAEGKTFKAFLREVKERTLEAFENQDYQFEELVDKVELKRDTSRNPLFDVVFIMQNMEMPGKNTPGLKIKPYEYENNISKFDLTLACIAAGEKLSFTAEYASKLFKQEMIQRITLHFKNILSQVLLDVNISITGVDMLSKEEKKKLLFDFNDTEADFPKDKTIHRLFEEQVERTPDNIAVIGMEHGAWSIEKHLEGTRGLAPLNITYMELNEKSNQLAYWLQEKGVKRETIAAIMIERSLEMIVGIMGILKAGGTYLPINPESPRNRILLMLADSKAGILLTKTTAVQRHSFTGSMNFPGEIIMLDEPGEGFAEKSPGNPGHLSQSKGLAYVIFTSGSTGKPRGVMVDHNSLVNRLNWMQKKYPLDENDTLLQKTPFTFDVSLWELFCWAVAGAKLYLLAPGGEGDPQLLVDTIEKNQVTVIHFVPSMLNAFLGYVKNCINIKRLSCLRQVFASGEALGISQVKLFNELLYNRNGTMITNLYGPTEATVEVSHFDCLGEDLEKTPVIPLGKPIDNIRLFVMSKDKQLQPVGVCGELCIAGQGLARGYLNNPGLTCEKFKIINYKLKIKNGSGALRADLNAFGNGFDKKLLRGIVRKAQSAGRKADNKIGAVRHAPGTMRLPPGCRRLYITGDLARWLPDGNIEFLGRIDNQVKIRGFRIELAEIENQLLEHKHIKEVVVAARENRDGNINEGEPGDKYLCAYYVSEEQLTVPDLRNHLLIEIHDYMIPSYFIRIEKIPLTANGKVDLKALPGPGGKVDTGTVYVPPGSKIEEELLNIWQEELNVEKIGMDDNFFDLGGNSILLLKLHSKINEKYPSPVNVVDLFNHTTIGKLAEFIENKGEYDNQKIELPLLILPGLFFDDDRGNENQRGIAANDVLTYLVKGRLLEKLKKISGSQGIPLLEIFLSIYIYMFWEITGKEEIALQSMIMEENQLESLSINLNNVETLAELFKLVAKSLNNHENRQLSINRISDFPLNKDKHAILTLFYCKNLLRFNGQLTDVYDIVFEIDEQGDYIEFSCEYTNRFKKEKIDEMMEMYLQLLDVLTQTG